MFSAVSCLTMGRKKREFVDLYRDPGFVKLFLLIKRA